MNCLQHNSYRLLLVVLLCIFLQRAEAQTEFVTLVSITGYSMKIGETNPVELTFIIADEFHIQPAFVRNNNFVPTELIIDPLDGLTFKKPEFPVPDSISVGKDLLFLGYRGTLKVSVPVFVEPGTTPGPHDITVTLSYQACKATSCFFPRKLNITTIVWLEQESLNLPDADGPTTDKQPPG
jgi:hypothetical protein